MKGFGRLGLDSLASVGVMAFSLANLNTILTTIILVLTIVYWVKKIAYFKRNKDDGFN